jgi:hypothetical protein
VSRYLSLSNCVQIAWDYLERSGELGDAAYASYFLSQTIGKMVRQGERRKLLLSNRAIEAYQNHMKREVA